MGGRRVLWQLALFAISSTTLACGILLGVGGGDGPADTTAPSGPDGNVLEATLVDSPFGSDANTLDGDSSVDAGCPQCASGHCPSGSTLCDPLVFVTDEDYTGDFAEIADASGVDRLDVACNRSAAKAGVPGYYKAWVTSDDGSTKPSERLIHTARPFRRRDGVVVVQDFNGFFAPAGLNQRISVSAKGTAVLDKTVWTGTRTDMTPDTRDCVGWTSGLASGEEGLIGKSSCVPPTACPPEHWTFWATSGCHLRSRVYCLEQIP